MKFRTMTVADMLEGFTDNMSQKQMDKELELFQNIADTLKITGRDYSSLGVLIDEDYMVENETINNLVMKYVTQDKISSVVGHTTCELLTDEEEVICICKVSIDRDAHSWNITSWHTKEGFKNQGFGKATMQKALAHCMKTYEYPVAIRYTWNGVNNYVLDWLIRHFNAKCTCPIAVQKTQPDDDWSSHIYELNKEKVLKYFKLSIA